MRLEAHVQDRSEAVYLMNKILGICQLFDTVSCCLILKDALINSLFLIKNIYQVI